MLRSQALDSGDLLDALEQSGSSSEVAEELVGRVVSLTSTNEFFVPLALQHLKKVRKECGSDSGCTASTCAHLNVKIVQYWFSQITILLLMSCLKGQQEGTYVWH